MGAWIIVLTVIDALVALLLIGVVLVQQSKDSGFGGGTFGGIGESVFGGQAGDHIVKLTVFLAGAFLIITLTLAIITGRRHIDEKGVIDQLQSSEPAIVAAPQPKKSEKDLNKAVVDVKKDISKKSDAVKTTLEKKKKDIETKKDIKTDVSK